MKFYCAYFYDPVMDQTNYFSINEETIADELEINQDFQYKILHTFESNDLAMAKVMELRKLAGLF